MKCASPTSVEQMPARDASIRGGLVVKSDGTLFRDRVFYLHRGRRHWVPNADWFAQNGYRFPHDVGTVSDELLLTYLPGQPAPLRYSPPLPGKGLASVSEARDVAASQLRGAGVEIGAYASPFPVPLDCLVQYADACTYEDLLAHAYPGQALHDILMPTLRTDLDSLAGIGEQSLDFLVACHVIEHVRNPVGALARAYSVLREGGQLVLVVPDKERTFDRNRDLTSLEHLIQDFHSPDRERDQMHFREFYAKAEGFKVPEEAFEHTWRTQWEAAFPIHYHTWTFASFMAMVAWAVRDVAPFRQVWSHPPVTGGIEFYCTLTK
jgi:SAM-dependent methyltransferase